MPQRHHTPHRSHQGPQQPRHPSMDWAPPGGSAAPAGGMPAPQPGGPGNRSEPTPDRLWARWRRIPTAVRVLVVTTVVMTLLIGAVWLAGGFRTRSWLQDKQAGEVLDLGPMQIIMNSARQAGALVYYYGTCQLTENWTDSLIKLEVSNSSTAFARIDGQLVKAESTFLKLGAERGSEDGFRQRELLSPGLQPIPCAFVANFPKGEMTDRTVLVVHKLEYGDPGNVKSDDESGSTWHATLDGYGVLLQLER